MRNGPPASTGIASGILPTILRGILFGALAMVLPGPAFGAELAGVGLLVALPGVIGAVVVVLLLLLGLLGLACARLRRLDAARRDLVRASHFEAIIGALPGGLLCTLEDITDRLTLESSYNTLIAVQRETLDNLFEGVAVFGAGGRLKLSNPAFLLIWRLPAEIVEEDIHVSQLIDRVRDLFESDENWQTFREQMIVHITDRQARSGRIELASKPGQGTKMICHLPLRSPSVAAVPAPASPILGDA